MADASLITELGRHDFFGGLDTDSIEFLAACAQPRRLDAGEVMIRHGDPARSFYLVRRGRINREVPSICGAPLVMHSIGAGELLGWSWFVPPYRWNFLARADAPTEVLEFDATAVLARCEEDPRFGYSVGLRFSGLMCDRLARAREKMIDDWRPPGFR